MRINHGGRLRCAVYGSVLAGTAGWGLPLPAEADAASAAGPVQLPGVDVTGSRIPRIDSEGATPVEVITAAQITRSGFNTVQQLFDNLSLNVGGSLGRNQTFGFTPGASGVDLRGLGVGRTLVLIDGRRPPVYPVAAGGEDNFVDLSSIPTSIVDRIEILTTGGSAIYGSDAVSGVINIITRKRLGGLIGSVRAGKTEYGGYDNQRYELSYGFHDDKNSLVVAGQYFHNNPLKATQRSYSRSDLVPGQNALNNYSEFGASFLDFGNGAVIPASPCGAGSPIGPGLVVRPGPNSFDLAGTQCGFDRARFQQLFPATEQGSLYLSLEHQLDVATAYVRGSYNTSTTAARSEAFPYYSPQIAAGAPNNPGGATGGYGYFYRRAIEFGARGANIENLTASLLVGLKGLTGDYAWDVGVSRQQVRADDSVPSIIKAQLDDFVCGGAVNPDFTCAYTTGPGLNLLDPIPQDVVAASTYLKTMHAISQVTAVDATISGPVPGLNLPGGPLQVALFTGFDRQSYSNLNDPISSAGLGVDGAVSARGNRSHAAAAVEFSLPIISELHLGLAGRYDGYNTSSGGQFTGQGALQYRPREALLLRGSIGSLFRAPDLQRLYGGTTTGFQSAIDAPACVAAGGTVADPDSPAVCTTTVASIPTSSSGDPTLKSEKGTNYSFGVVVEPVERLTLSIDYYYIQLRKAVQSLSAQDVLNQCANTGALCDLITRDANGTLNRGLIITDPMNTAGYRQKGIDGRFSYELRTRAFGLYNLSTTATYLFSSKYQAEFSSPEVQQLGYLSVPRYRFTTMIDWSRGPFGASLVYLYVPRIPGISTSLPATRAQYLRKFDQMNAQLSYAFGTWGTIRIGINNLFGTPPPIDPTDTSIQFTGGAASSFSNAFGREGYLQYEFRY